MTPLLFLFSTLCIISNGEQDCSFQWTEIEDRVEFEEQYELYKGDSNLDSERVGAFTVTSERKIFYFETNMNTVVHEIDHAKCIIENKNLSLRELCHVTLDTKDQASKSTHEIDETPTPPIVSNKMAFREMIFSNHILPTYIGDTQ